jgi:spore germination protein GerM
MKISNKSKRVIILSSKSGYLLTISFFSIFFLVFSMGCSILGNLGLNNSSSLADNTDIQESSSEQKSDAEQKDESAVEKTDSSDAAEDTAAGEAAESTVEETESTNSISTEEITINVYYADANGEYLVGEARIVSGSSKYVDAITEMMKEPVDGSLIKLIPETTRINSVIVSDGVAKVDLSKNFVGDRFVSDVVDILLVYSIVNTLTEFPDINSVEFLIDGEKLEVLGQLDLQEPLFRRSDLIKIE